MTMRRPLLIAMLVPLLAPVAVHAQDGFLFQQPVAQLTFRVGPVMHRAQSDVFDFMTSELTLDRGDFTAPAVEGEVAFMVHERADIAVGLGWSKTERNSESRFWVGDDDLPIQQVTRYSTMPLTVSGRYYPFSRGERVSDLAWVPVRTTPYVGGGGGLTWYRLQQEGEFVEAVGPDEGRIFEDEITSHNHAFTGHLLAGANHWFSPRVGVNVEGRYTWGRADVGGDYLSGPAGEWDGIDLSGFQAGIGLSVRW